MKVFSKIKDGFNKTFSSSDEEYPEEFTSDYVELDAEGEKKAAKGKIMVRPYVIQDFADVKPLLDSIREGSTIALVNIRPLKDRDVVELKRAINKVKKTCEAIDGDLAGFGEDWLVVTPSFASVFRNKQIEEIKEQ